MTNNLDDFDQPPEMDEHEEGLPPPSAPRGFKGNLAEAWRTRPLFKLMVLMIAVGAVIAVSISIFSGGSSPEVSRFVKPPTLNEPAGGPASPYFVQQTKEAEAQRANQALQSGGSALPTPIGQTANLDELGGDKNKKDPLVELRAETEHLKQQLQQVQQQQQAPQQPQQQQKQEAFDDSLAQAMQRQMQQLMESWVPKGEKDVTVSKEDEKKAKEAEMAANGMGPNGAPLNTQVAPPRVLVPAGTVSYAQLLTEANSDVPGPILAQIVSGPLSGARAVGRFEVMNDYLVLHFRLADKKGKDYGIDAIALDPDTTLGGMATEVDQRYFTRVLLPAAAGFMQGFGAALSAGSSSVVTNGDTTIVSQSGKGLSQGAFQGLSQGAQTMATFFENQANTVKPLVRVAAGTPMGLFFVASVTDQTLDQLAAMQQGVPGYGGYGGYGTGYGYGGQQQGMPLYGNASQQSGYYSGASGYNSGYGSSSVPYPNAGVPYPQTSTGYPGSYNSGYNPAAAGYPAGTTVPNTGVGTTIVTH